ncbi:heat shock factor protein 2-like isoform X2 [Linepithema humile]|uniref:heat shock factor protein 2-like isoform X2 n=1 Tax=Linepithema humile TaxID=83485 RepID=UPI000623049F|nr:PREDICTED: heat shock factor protein 2-like isoform X2 [Linepithema humile]
MMNFDIKQIRLTGNAYFFIDYCRCDTAVFCFADILFVLRRTKRDERHNNVRNILDSPFAHNRLTMTTKIFEDCVLQSMRFPQKLWQIVNACKTGAIQWGVNGNTILLDYKRFQAEYLDARLPIFKTNNITSFIRQLNLYGFRKVTFHDRESYHPDVHEFVHDNFRADRIDLLSKVCRKTCTKGKYLHDVVKSTEDSPRKELALTKTLEQITEEYRRKIDEKRPLLTQDATLKRIKTSQDTVPVLYKIEFNSVLNRKPAIKRVAKYSAFLPSKSIDTFDKKEIPSSWYIHAMDKNSICFKI